ncbi:MAG: acetylxylan esterase [Planctomycetota bacterium]
MPTLGHRHHLVEALAAKAAQPLSYLSGNYSDQETWRGYARKKIFELLHYAPPRVDFQAEVGESDDLGDFTRRKVWFSSSQHTRVSAYLLVPRITRGKLPGILCLHDHGGLFAWGKEKVAPAEADEHPALAEHKQAQYAGQSVAAELARAGFAVLATDLFYFGDRRLSGIAEVDGLDLSDPEQHAAFEEIARANEAPTGLNLIQAGATLMGLHVWDAIRAAEYLTTVQGVDARRIGCFGAHSGGLLALYLSGLCDLVRATVAVGWVSSLRRVVESGVPGTSWTHFAVPGLSNFLDLPDIACLTVPRALMLAALNDEPLFPAADADRAFADVRKVYREAGKADDFLSQTSPGRAVTPTTLREAVRWFERWI